MCFRIGGMLIAPCEKVTPSPASDSWLKRAGKYRIENPDPGQWLTEAGLQLDRTSGFYVLELALQGAVQKFPLQVLSDTEARIMGVGRNLGETLRIVPAADGEKLMFQGYVLSRR